MNNQSQTPQLIPYLSYGPKDFLFQEQIKKIFEAIRKESNDNKILKQGTIFQDIELWDYALITKSVRKVKNEIRTKEEIYM